MMIYHWVWVVPTEWKLVLVLVEPAVAVVVVLAVLVELLINFVNESNPHPPHYSYCYWEK